MKRCTCGNPNALICEQCEKPFCMDCFCRYEVALTSRICWLCQSEADQEWIRADFKEPRRTWPRKSVEAL